MEGRIIVDGVLVSCYALFDHDLAHFAMTPFHWFAETIEWVFNEVNGMPSFVEIVMKFGRVLLPYGQLFQTKSN